MGSSYHGKFMQHEYSNVLVLRVQIVHEVMHAVGHVVPIDGDEPIREEPYFEMEALAELGFGYEAAVSRSHSRLAGSNG